MSLAGVASHGKNRSRELAEEMADGWAGIMQRYYDMPTMTAAFLINARRPVGVDDTAFIDLSSTDDVSAALKTLKRGKTSGPNEIGNSFTEIIQGLFRRL